MIRFSCPNCDRTIKADDSRAGKRANCPGCQSEIRVPIAEAAPVAVGVDHSPSQFDEPFEPWNDPIADATPAVPSGISEYKFQSQLEGVKAECPVDLPDPARVVSSTRPSPRPRPSPTAAPDPTEAGLLTLVTDYRLHYYATPQVLRAIWIVGVLIILVASVYTLYLQFQIGGAALLAIAVPIVVGSAAGGILLLRIACELTMVAFNIARHLAALENDRRRENDS